MIDTPNDIISDIKGIAKSLMVGREKESNKPDQSPNPNFQNLHQLFPSCCRTHVWKKIVENRPGSNTLNILGQVSNFESLNAESRNFEILTSKVVSSNFLTSKAVTSKWSNFIRSKSLEMVVTSNFIRSKWS